MKILTLIIILFFSFENSYAIDIFQNGMTTRSAAMGGTGVAFVKGPASLFINPASLARVEGFSLNIANLNLALSSNALDLKDEFHGSSNITSQQVDSLYGKKIFTEASVYGGAVIPYFGVGAYSANTVLMSFNNPSFPTFNVDFVSDYSYVVGFAVPLAEKTSFGVAGRHVKRWGDKANILVSDLIGNDAQEVIKSHINSKGKGNALDLSFLTTVKGPGDGDLNIAAVWKDVGDTKFDPTLGAGPERQENNLILGLALINDWKGLVWTNAFEYKFVRNDGDITKKLHLGTELSLGLVDLRAGYGQGYLSYGAALDLSFLVLEAAIYSSELGTSAGQTESNRYQLGLSLNLDFDQSFKLQSSEGKRRRLLQRR